MEAHGGGGGLIFKEEGGEGGWSMVDTPRSSIKSIPRSEKEKKERGRSVTPIRCP